MDSGENLDERRLSRAVLANEPVNRGARYYQVRAIQRANSAELPGDAGRFARWRFVVIL